MNAVDVRTCVRCVMDTSDSEIDFDATGLCNHCRDAEVLFRTLPTRVEGGGRLKPLVDRIKSRGTRRDYDAIIGLSGGADSSYAASLMRQHDVRTLAVHFDNGWNSELAVENIQRVVEGCELDLVTYVIDWSEFRDIQRSFLQASVIDIEMITDHAILASLVRLAEEHRIPFLVSGTNLSTEHGMPATWVWDKLDWTNIKAIHDRFGKVPLRTFPHLTRKRSLAIRAGREPRIIQPLDLVPYRRDEAVEMLRGQFGWRDYGGKHHESVFTRFYQSWILPTKFGVDKRMVHLSARIRNGELTREEALEALTRPLYQPGDLAVERQFVLKKLGFTDAEFDEIMGTPPRSHDAFPTDRPMTEALRTLYRPVRSARSMLRMA